MGLHSFNLLQGNVAPPDMWDNIYDWVTNVGRVIVIIVEVVVIISFGLRIVIDTQTKNLMEAEQQYQTSLNAFKQKEIDYLDLQERFSTYKSIWNGGSSYSAVIDEIVSEIPNRIEGLSINVKDNTITVSGEALESDVGSFESALKQSESFTDVRVPELESVAQKQSSRSRPRSAFTVKIVAKVDLLKQREQIGAAAAPAAAPAQSEQTQQPAAN